MIAKTALTASTLRSSILNPALDGIALNIEQRDLIFDPSPERDSLVEGVSSLHALSLHHMPPASRAISLDLIGLLARLAASNHGEGERERLIAGVADRLAADLHRLETTDPMRQALNAKAIARRLREPLRTLAAADADTVDAFCALNSVLRSLPAAQVLTPAVAHELGRAPFDLLRRLCERRGVSGFLPAAGAASPE